jgi:hypothetical protein
MGDNTAPSQKTVEITDNMRVIGELIGVTPDMFWKIRYFSRNGCAKSALFYTICFVKMLTSIDT